MTDDLRTFRPRRGVSLESRVLAYVRGLNLPEDSIESALASVAITMAEATDKSVERANGGNAAAQTATQVRAALMDLRTVLKEDAPEEDSMADFLLQMRSV